MKPGKRRIQTETRGNVTRIVDPRDKLDPAQLTFSTDHWPKNRVYAQPPESRHRYVQADRAIKPLKNCQYDPKAVKVVFRSEGEVVAEAPYCEVDIGLDGPHKTKT